MHILCTVSYTFPKVMTRRMCSTIKSCTNRQNKICRQVEKSSLTFPTIFKVQYKESFRHIDHFKVPPKKLNYQNSKLLLYIMKINVAVPLTISFSFQEDKQRKTTSQKLKFPRTARMHRNA